MSKKVLIFMIIFSLCLIAGSLYIISQIDPAKKIKSTAEVANIANAHLKVTEDFDLHTSTGEKFTLANLQNKFTILYFGFTFCPDICPTTVKYLKAVSEYLAPDELKQLQFVFVSIDPFRDKDQELHSFVSEYGGKHMIGVNGTEKEVDKLALALKVYHAKEPGKEDNYRIAHTGFVYLLNPQAELIAQYTQEADGADILAGVKAKLAEYNNQSN